MGLEGRRPLEFSLVWTEVRYGNSGQAVAKGCIG